MNETQKNNQKYTEELEKIEEIRQRWLKKKKKDKKWEKEKEKIRFKRTGGAV